MKRSNAPTVSAYPRHNASKTELRAGTYVIGMPCPIASSRAVLRDIQFGRQRRAADGAEIDFHDTMLHGALQSSLRRGTFQFAAMALTIIDAQRVGGETIVPGDRQRGRTIEPAAEEDDGLALLADIRHDIYDSGMPV